MSKIGKRPIKILEGVEISLTPEMVVASYGDKKLELSIPSEIKVKVEEGMIIVDRIDNSIPAKAKHGLISRLISNMIQGVKEGFTKELTFSGTGYRATLNGSDLVLNMGYSHEIKLPVPEGLETKVVKNTIAVSGIDKAKVGQFAAEIRAVRPPEVYKGKGIKYKNEFIKRKAGKTAASK